jgi:hypothetical protein
MGLYEKYLHATFTLITQRLTSLQYYQVQTIEFLQHVQLLITGKISPRFIEAATIEKLILYEDIQRDLNKHYPTFFITNTDVSAFYNTPYFIIIPSINVCSSKFVSPSLVIKPHFKSTKFIVFLYPFIIMLLLPLPHIPICRTILLISG